MNETARVSPTAVTWGWGLGGGRNMMGFLWSRLAEVQMRRKNKSGEVVKKKKTLEVGCGCSHEVGWELGACQVNWARCSSVSAPTETRGRREPDTAEASGPLTTKKKNTHGLAEGL